MGNMLWCKLEPVITVLGRRVAGVPSVFDFPFYAAVRYIVVGTKAPDWLEKLFSVDPLYGDDRTALRLPTFTGNHDFCRFAHFARKAFPAASSPTQSAGSGPSSN